MNDSARAEIPEAVVLNSFRSPQTVIGRFVARRTMRSAAFWALAFGAIVASKSTGYAAVYPTLAAREKLAASFSSNISFSALFGTPHHLETVAGYTVWNSMAGPVIIGAIWAFLLATKTLRGEENAGRWELLLAGQTTARRATANALAGLTSSLAVLYAVTALTFIAVGRVHSVDFGTSAALFFALATVSSAILFMSVGALASQIMPTRSRAASLSAGIFGVCFLMRSVADTTSAHWLLNFTPLGWIEKLQPLFGSQSIWLLPIIGSALFISAVTIWLSGRRDLGGSLLADKDTAKPHLAFLNSPFQAAIRLTRTTSFSWIAVISFVALFFGLLTKAATQAFTSSSTIEHDIGRVVQGARTLNATIFLGMIFFLVMPLLMAYVASAVGRVREDEAEGYIDNFLVRPVSRMRWLWGRITLITAIIIIASLCAGIGTWVGAVSVQSGIAFHTLFLAGLNIIAPALFTLGIGIAALGIIPRLTTVIAYGVIAWSFLIQILSSGINISHWLVDTSVLNHVKLAPAVNPNWQSAGILAVLGFALCGIGAYVFNTRDLQAE